MSLQAIKAEKGLSSAKKSPASSPDMEDYEVIKKGNDLNKSSFYVYHSLKLSEQSSKNNLYQIGGFTYDEDNDDVDITSYMTGRAHRSTALHMFTTETIKD